MMQTHRAVVLLLWGLVVIQLLCHQAAAQGGEDPDHDKNLTPEEDPVPYSGGAPDEADPDGQAVDKTEGTTPVAFEKGEVETLQLGKPVDGYAPSTGNKAPPSGYKLILVADPTDRTITRLTTEDDNSFQWARYDVGNGTNRPIALEYDLAGDYIYWTTVNGANSRVSRSPYETGPGQRLDGQTALVPDGIAVDVISRNLYWTDTGIDKIIVSRLDGSFRKSLITTGLDEPRAIVVDPNAGYMYWTDWGGSAKIERAALDGTQRSVIVNVGVGQWPNGLALDKAANRLYWCNGATGQIWTSGVTGSSPVPTQLFTHNNAHVFGMAVDETYLYWTAWNVPGIHRIGKNLQGYVNLNIPHFQKLHDIHVRTTANTPTQPNACSTSNGNCAQLCLPVPGGGRTCACQDGWSLGSDGRTCVSAACLPNPCQNGGKCVGQPQSSSLTLTAYTCTCLAGFSGANCQTNDDDCRPTNPCQNGGQCVDGINSYTCRCATGFSGDRCQTNINDCPSPNPCQNGGQCVDGINSYTCRCATGFSGNRCQTNINDCPSTNPCQNGGQCVDGINTFTCRCATGFSGDRCQTNINDCPSTNPCQNGGQCVDGVNTFTCRCLSGFSGDRCQTNLNDCPSPNPCQNGGQCVDGINSYTCRCTTGFSGSRCQTNINDCPSTNPCQNGGQCVDGINIFTCRCATGFSGNRCQTNINDCPSPNPCQNGGQCVDGINSYTCRCATGFSENHCQTNDDDCPSPDPCQNGGQCVDGINSYTCRCATGFSGPRCETNDDNCPSPNPCQNGGQCVDGINTFTCRCAPGFSGNRCEINDDNCPSPDPCQNGGQCVDGINTFTCRCAPGFSGNRCEINDDDCAPTNPCQNGGQCVDGVNSYTCRCPDGFWGAHCEIAPTTAQTTWATKSVCEPGWFHHEGTCYCLLTDPSTYSEAARSCADLDLYGRLAVVKRPSTHQFLLDYVEGEGGGSPWIGIDDGTTEGVWKYVDGDLVSDPFNEWADGTWNSRKKDCVRMSEIFGYDWQPVPCNTRSSYICEYPVVPPTDTPNTTPGVIERCEEDTCNQGGICIDGETSYRCYCLPGYLGEHCETETDECDPDPCQNGGVCTDGQLSYTCKCPHGFAGVNCELTCPSGFRLFGDQCYWFSPTAVRNVVATAETDCDARGARLACVKSEEEHNFIKMTIATTNRRPHYIGLSDRAVEGTFVHSDGTALGSFRPFRTNSNVNNRWKDCVIMWPSSSYQWLYYSCNSRRNYVCQRAASP